MNNLEERDDRVEDAWAGSLREVLRDVIKTLPSKVTLGELVDATRSNPQLAPVLEHFTVQELIDLVKDRPRDEPSDLVPLAKKPASGEVLFDEEGNPILDLDAGPAVIRRRADVPDGDVRLLSVLNKQKAGRRENELLQTTGLASDQVRLILRNCGPRALSTSRAPHQATDQDHAPRHRVSSQVRAGRLAALSARHKDIKGAPRGAPFFVCTNQSKKGRRGCPGALLCGLTRTISPVR